MDPGYWWGPMFGFPWIFPIICFIFMAAMIFVIFTVFRRAGGCCMPMRHGRAEPRNDAHEMRRRIESQ